MADDGTTQNEDQAINSQELSKKWAQLLSHADDQLKQRLKDNPETVLREHGFDIPSGYDVSVAEDAAPRLDLKLTPKQSAELTADQLSSVAGGVKAKAQAVYLQFKIQTVIITGL